jgi:hypothetical protein
LTLLGLLAVLISQPSWALAGTSGNIAGIVRNEATGAPVAGARLQITSASQSVATVTDSHGHFIVFQLQPDDYTITAEKEGYDTRSVSGYSVFADETQQYDVKLNPSSGT